MKKLSKYNYWYSLRNKTVLYNILSDELLVLLPPIVSLIKENVTDIDKIGSLHPDLYQVLLDMSMIVDDTVDESELVVEMWKKEDMNSETFSMTINPTLDCNLRCWYCYEKHSSASKMSHETLSALCLLMKKKIENESLKIFNINFFGGEPLLYYSEVMRPLLQYAKELCDKNNKVLNLSATTNGVLLSKEIIADWSGYTTNSPLNLQITIDGNRKQHDKVRKTINEEPTYNLIVKNIKECLFVGCRVMVRFNYTHENANTFIDVIKDFSEIPLEYRDLLSFSFHQVWQDKPTNSIEQEIETISQYFKDENFRVEHPPKISRNRCYADTPNHIVVNYNGYIYNCTARDFTIMNREGLLTDDGAIEWEPRYYERRKVVYGNNTCRKCRIFPICHGGCSQNKLETGNKGCIKGYTKSDIERVLEKRVSLILSENM